MVRTLYARKVSTVTIFSIVIRLLSRCIYFQQTKNIQVSIIIIIIFIIIIIIINIFVIILVIIINLL